MDRLVLLIGASGSGQTTLAKELEKEGYNIIQSYTDRKPREEWEWGHTFISKDYIPRIEDVITYKTIYGNRYFATKDQYQGEGTSIYVIDPSGAEQVRENVKDAEIVTIFLMAGRNIRELRMGWDNRSSQNISDRLWEDSQLFKTIKTDYVVDANRSIEEVLADVKEIINGQPY